MAGFAVVTGTVELEGLSTKRVVLQFLGFSVVLCIWPVVCGHG